MSLLPVLALVLAAAVPSAASSLVSSITAVTASVTVPSFVSAAVPTALSEAGTLSVGESVLLVVVALVTVACGLGVLTARRAVVAAVNMIGIMISLAVLYIANEAPFLGMTQVVVYTGAVMTLVLFVIMLVGVGGEEPVAGAGGSYQLPLIGLLGLGLATLLAAVLHRSPLPAATGLQGGDASTPDRIAEVLLGDHVVTMELTGILLVVAAVGALTLTHRQRVRARRGQAEIAEEKMRAYAATGAHPGQKPVPGVYASTNTVAAPALGADGQEVTESVPRVLRARGQGMELSEVSPEMGVAQRAGEVLERQAGSRTTGKEAAGGSGDGSAVGRSGMSSMPGQAPPVVEQPVAPSPVLRDTSQSPASGQEAAEGAEAAEEDTEEKEKGDQ
ncbi:NADH-quinone oxidoreductase subunit J [Actinomyces lilanjuaniae]|uniref:NADH-quinone oxidoreductase subunit J n=1 Tax=Actinomyces lilanjuaniae TaxID=2321394 RepID=A0ABN5PPH6_9ACTO|nr:NADH-quinone oxidoreductase subunit J [Actinomyces lilanjuaniae]AYD90295.1 NADH-quinone oxidoreductase subunit J [Actinomyces lilanjuaniae]